MLRRANRIPFRNYTTGYPNNKRNNNDDDWWVYIIVMYNFLLCSQCKRN